MPPVWNRLRVYWQWISGCHHPVPNPPCQHHRPFRIVASLASWDPANPSRKTFRSALSPGPVHSPVRCLVRCLVPPVHQYQGTLLLKRDGKRNLEVNRGGGGSTGRVQCRGSFFLFL